MLEALPLAHEVLRRLRIVPQRRVFDLCVQLLQSLVGAVPVEEPAQQRGRGVDLVDMGLRFGAHCLNSRFLTVSAGPIRARSPLATRRAARVGAAAQAATERQLLPVPRLWVAVGASRLAAIAAVAAPAAALAAADKDRQANCRSLCAIRSAAGRLPKSRTISHRYP